MYVHALSNNRIQLLFSLHTCIFAGCESGEKYSHVHVLELGATIEND